MYNIIRLSISSFVASNYSASFVRYLRNNSKRVSVLKTIKEFKVKHMDDGFEDSFDLQEMTKRIRENDLDIEETIEKGGDDFETIVSESGKLYATQFEEKLSKKSFVKKKLVGRKYFKGEKETNLLTCAAKEQIRYLHKLNPSDWSPETLSKSFPTSVEGVKKLLKSYFILKDPVKIKRHDEDVKRKWESLMSNKPSDDIYLRTQYLWKQGKILKENYNGNPNLPYTTESATEPIMIRKNKPMGEYSAIIKNYIEYKSKIESPQKTVSEQIPPPAKQYNRRNSLVNAENDPEAEDFIKKSKVFKEEGDLAFKRNYSNNEAELPFSQFKENMKHQIKYDSKKSNTSKQYHQWIEKEVEVQDVKNKSSPYDVKEFVSKISKYNKDNVEMKRGENNSEDSFYLYDDKTGYQRPVGQSIKGKISIPVSRKKRSSLYKLKNCVYDEDGEFLYKLPS